MWREKFVFLQICWWRSTERLGKLTLPRKTKKFPVLYGTRRFITVHYRSLPSITVHYRPLPFITVHCRSLPSIAVLATQPIFPILINTNPFHSSHRVHSNIILPFMLSSSKWTLFFGISHQNVSGIAPLPLLAHAPPVLSSVIDNSIIFGGSLCHSWWQGAAGWGQGVGEPTEWANENWVAWQEYG